MARACAEAGAKAIALFDANQELGDTSAAELHAKTGLPMFFYKIDMRDVGAINAAVQSVTSSYRQTIGRKSGGAALPSGSERATS